MKWKDEATGLICEAQTVPLLRRPHWVGYVLLPPGHPWHGKDYDDLPVEIHGGLTYGDADGENWKVGFDAAHAGDGWQDEAWARRECAKLAEQASAARKPQLEEQR